DAASHPWTGALELGGGLGGRELPTAGTQPAGRWGPAVVYDPTAHRVLVIAGYDGSPYGGPGKLRNEVWELSLGAEPVWKQLQPSGEPPTPQYFSSAVFDPVRQRVILHGGNVGFSETSALDLGGALSWNRLATEGDQPAPRLGHGMAYDATEDRVVMFGGNSPGDVWALNFDELWRDIGIDILPGSPSNSITLPPHGILPVAILGSNVFDVRTVRASTVRVGGVGPQLGTDGSPRFLVRDANRDGYEDLELYVDASNLTLNPAQTQLELVGELLDGSRIRGSDHIRVVGTPRGLVEARQEGHAIQDLTCEVRYEASGIPSLRVTVPNEGS